MKYYRRLIVVCFLISAIVCWNLLPKNSTISVPERSSRSPVLACARVNLQQYVQPSINDHSDSHKFFRRIGLDYIPELLNPCWYERFSESDLRLMLSNPYHITYAEKAFKGRRSFKKAIEDIVDLYSAMLKENRTARVRCLPGVYIIGQPKCASSDFYDAINAHPQMRAGLVKETQWWTWTSKGIVNKTRNESSFGKERLPLELSDFADHFSYVSMDMQRQLEVQCKTHFENKCNQQLISDGSIFTLTTAFEKLETGSQRNMVLDHPMKTPSYVKWLVPNAKLILLVREPGERMYSAYKYFIAKNKRILTEKYKDVVISPSNFHETVTTYINKFKLCIKRKPIHKCRVIFGLPRSLEMMPTDSLYAHYLEEWIKVFGKNSILVIRTEDYQKHRIETLKETFRFLGVCELPVDVEEQLAQSTEVNKGHVDVGPMLNETRKFLNDFFEPYNKHLARLLNDRKFLWEDYLT